MLPIKSEVPTRTFPITTLALIAINAGLFVRALLLPEEAGEDFILNLALIPHEFTPIRPK